MMTMMILAHPSIPRCHFCTTQAIMHMTIDNKQTKDTTDWQTDTQRQMNNNEKDTNCNF